MFLQSASHSSPFCFLVQLSNQRHPGGYSWSQEGTGRAAARCGAVHVCGDLTQDFWGKAVARMVSSRGTQGSSPSDSNSFLNLFLTFLLWTFHHFPKGSCWRVVCFAVLETEPRASHMLVECSAMELYPQFQSHDFCTYYCSNVEQALCPLLHMTFLLIFQLTCSRKSPF